MENGKTIADSTAQSLNSAACGAENVVALVAKITEATVEQASSIAQLTQGIDQISGVVQTTSAASEESAAAWRSTFHSSRHIKGFGISISP